MSNKYLSPAADFEVIELNNVLMESIEETHYQGWDAPDDPLMMIASINRIDSDKTLQ